MKANLHHRGQRRTPRKTRRRRRSVAHTARSRHFDAAVRKQIFFVTSSVFSAPFFTSFFTALAPFFTSVPVSVAAVFVASAVLSAASSVASPVFTAAFLVACAGFFAAGSVALPVSSAGFFTSVPAWPYENAVSTSSAAVIVIIKENFPFIVPPAEFKSSSVANFYQS